MRRKVFLTLMISTLMLLLAVSEGAALMLFTEETSFQTAIGGAVLNTEGFNTIELGLRPGPVSFGGVSVNTQSGSVNGTDDTTLYVSEGARAISWADLLIFGSFHGDITFTFTSPINAFALDIKDLGYNPGSPPNSTLSVSLNGGSFFEAFSNVTGDAGNLRFLGLIDDMSNFTTVTFSNTPVDVLGLDRLQYGEVEVVEPVPEPTTMLLIGTGLVGFVGLRRKFRK